MKNLTITLIEGQFYGEQETEEITDVYCAFELKGRNYTCDFDATAYFEEETWYADEFGSEKELVLDEVEVIVTTVWDEDGNAVNYLSKTELMDLEDEIRKQLKN